MYYELTKEEIKKFIERHFNPYDDTTWGITRITMIKFRGYKEYLINDKFTLKIYNHEK